MLHRAASLLFALLVALLCSPSVYAQDEEEDVPPIAGVEVNPEGVLRVRRVAANVGRERIMAARQQLGAELAAKSELRKVSLNRLEAAIAKRVAAGEELTDAMRGVAGLTAVRYVFFYPDSGDIVLAGPAEGFVVDGAGRTRGIESGMPTILLEDLVTALRAYPAGGKGTNVISVSIDPTQEGLQRLNQTISQIRNVPRGGERAVAAALRDNLGLQTVTIRGVPDTTHFAQVLVEADYRMKLIGIGLERLPIRMQSYVERSTAHNSANAMERWYFEPDYECVLVSEDGLGMGLSGNAVRLVGAAEVVSAGGERQKRARGNRASQAFCHDFTTRFDEIANAVPVYAQLRNLIDLSIAAAFIQEQDYYTQAGWDMGVLLDESQLPVETLVAPQQVETAVNAIWKGNTLLTPLGGGVNVQPKRALKSDTLVRDIKGELRQPRQQLEPSGLGPDQWWWD
ncbi:DUF1598 domain-containing protein [Candidatus Laterigemmans baculatus]|nr:DUF1598 domain-containing protein [Candidatus Laterigemmans baculatus]